MATWIGVDPGREGGVAVLQRSGPPVVVIKIPESLDDKVHLFSRFVSLPTPIVCCIEKQWARPSPAEMAVRHGKDHKKARQGRGTVATGKLMEQYGELRGILRTYGIRAEPITPMKWQKALGCMTGGDKNVSKAEALARFPSVKVTQWNADALLLAHYAKCFYPMGLP